MAEETPAPSPAPAETVSTPSPDDSLKAIASEFTVEEQARQFTATPPAPQVQPQVYAPDPVTDSEGYKTWIAQQAQAQQQMMNALSQVSTEVQSFKQMQMQQKVNADVDRAVSIVNQKLKVDPDYAEALLNVEYSKNPSFKRIFDNREKNPLAYEKALNVLSDKLYSKVQVRQDPQLAENIRAAQSSQRTMATTKQPSPTEGVPDDPREFERWWRGQIQG